MAKTRIPIPKEVAAEILYLADWTCCKCNDRSREVQVHHIDEDPSNNHTDNLAVLCLLCHNETHSTAGFGRKLDSAQVILSKRKWDERVSQRRTEADKLFVVATGATAPERPVLAVKLPDVVTIPAQTGLVEFINSLPGLRRLAYEAARPKWAGSTVDMIEGSRQIVDILSAALNGLAKFYPYDHFGGGDSKLYFSELIGTRSAWHYHRLSTGGIGRSGTIIGPLAGGSVLSDVEDMVDGMVAALTMYGAPSEFSIKVWRTNWKEASER